MRFVSFSLFLIRCFDSTVISWKRRSRTYSNQWICKEDMENKRKMEFFLVKKNPIQSYLLLLPFLIACVRVYLLFQLKLYFSLVKRLVFRIIIVVVTTCYMAIHCCIKMECLFICCCCSFLFVRNYSSQLQLNVFHLIGSVSIVINQVVLCILYCVHCVQCICFGPHVRISHFSLFFLYLTR